MGEVGAGCVSVPGLVVCQPRGNRYRTVRSCRVCKQRRRFLVTLYAWYGPLEECCGCGTAWNDGYVNRPSKVKAKRDKRIRELKAEWLATSTTKDEALAWLFHQVTVDEAIEQS